MIVRFIFAFWFVIFFTNCYESEISSPPDSNLKAAAEPLVRSSGARTGSVGPGKISYLVRFPAPQTHYLEVEMRLPASQTVGFELMMPVWTPGSYLVREYSRHVEGVGARGRGDRALKVRKTAKNRWLIAADIGEVSIVSYRVYCREMSVRSNWVDSEFAVISPAATFMTVAPDGVGREHEVQIDLPAAWRGAYSGLPLVGNKGRIKIFLAQDFDSLVDSPFLIGTPKVYSFEVDGTSYSLVNQGEKGLWDGKKAAKDIEKIVRETVDLWGVVPYEDYTFLNVIDVVRGGLEHKNSTLMMVKRFAAKDPDQYISWLGLVSHEFFHTWNVKRMRPEALGPFDYEAENYTHGLWMSEGFTSYYDDLLLRRAGLVGQDKYLELLSKLIERVQTTPGRKVHSVGMSSFDAWIKYYRKDENTWNTTVSYYSKGAVIAFLLDAKIRKATEGKKNLDDLMRLAYERFSAERGFSRESFRETAEEVYGGSLGEFFEASVDGVGELDYSEALKWYGLEFGGEKAEDEDPDDVAAGWVGAKMSFEGGRFRVRRVPRGTPAYEFGLNAEDEVIALDSFRLSEDGWEDRLGLYRPGDRVELTIARRGVLRTLSMVLGKKPTQSWKLSKIEKPSTLQQAALEAWIGDGKPNRE